MSFTTVTVTGKYVTPAGAPAVGTVSFTLSAPIMDAAGKVIRTPATTVVTLDGTGAFSVALPANDDTGTVPTGTTYEVVEQLSLSGPRAYAVVVPHTAVAGTVDITALAPVANGSISYGVTSVNGQTGAVTISTGGSLTVQDENANIATGVTQIDFQGAGVTATAGTGEVVVTVPSAASPVRAGGTGVVGKGFKIPAGSLDIWAAARDASATTLAEAVIFGDSIVNGQTGTGNSYSWVQRLREKATAAGFADGGRGYNNFGKSTSGYDVFGSEPISVSAVTGFALGDTFSVANAPASAVAGDSITFKVVGTKCRLMWSRMNQGSRFTYQVNGGATVTVNAGSSEAPPIAATSGTQAWSPDTVLLTSTDGLTAGTNTIIVTNLGGSPVGIPPAPSLSLFNGTPGLAVATYYYKVTFAYGGGETPAGSEVSIAVPNTSNDGVQFTINSVSTGYVPPLTGTYNIYRSSTSGSGYQFLKSVSPIANGSLAGGTAVDDGSVTPTTGTPPLTNTTGLDTSSPKIHVNVEPINATGLVFHNNGVSGTRLVDRFNVNASDNNIEPAYLMGIQWGTNANGITAGLGSEQLPSAQDTSTDTPVNRAAARKPKLVAFAYGTNEIQQADDLTATTPAAPTATDGGVGIGSGLAAATYFYKVARVAPTGLGVIGPPSAASSGTAITATHQALVTMPQTGSAAGAVAWNVYRSTTSGGTYQYVGQAVGAQGVFVDNVATPGANMPSAGVTQPSIDTTQMENALGLGIRMARNAGADVLVVLPSIESMTNSRDLGMVFKAAMLKVAEAYSCAWIDTDIALGPYAKRAGLGYGGGNGNPHLLKPAYQAVGDFAWTNVLSR